MSGTRSALAVVAVAAGLLAWSADPALAAGPALRIVPAPAAAGTTVTAFGQGWCASGCPPVRIAIAGNTVATAVPRADGSFAVRFVVRVAPSQYQVTGTQDDPAARRTATTGLLVLPADPRSAPPPPRSTASPTPPRTTASPTATPSPPSSSRPPPPPTTTATPPQTASATDLPLSRSETSAAGGRDGREVLLWVLLLVAVAAAAAATAVAQRRRPGRHRGQGG